MYPMLRNRRDTVVIRRIDRELKRYDVVLYRCKERYVLHRILAVTEEGYLICGDNCIQKEPGIKKEQIVGVLEIFFRDERCIRTDNAWYRFYARLWVTCYPVRCFLKKLKRKIRR